MNADSEKIEEDVNDAFFEILLAESKFSKIGHQEGFTKGLRQGRNSGFDLGVVKGFQIGSEVAFYRGFIETVRLLVNDDVSSKRITKVLDSLDQATSAIPPDVTRDSAVIDTLEFGRAKFRQICSVMNISVDSNSKPNLDF